jgi:hypothetical protein
VSIDEPFVASPVEFAGHACLEDGVLRCCPRFPPWSVEMSSRTRCVSGSLIALGAVLIASPVRAGEPFRFPEGKHGQGELKYRNGVPVLTVSGTPKEIGEQVAALIAQPSARLLKYPREVLTHFASPAGVKVLWPRFVQKANGYSRISPQTIAPNSKPWPR